ncbi:MAG: hypothetical protein II912_03270 [Clostridia bacterium]|nr:hypothetical protein [Clostridia bacterium]
MKRFFRTFLSLALVLVLLTGMCPAVQASSYNNVGQYEIYIANITTASITEIYLFPSYSSSLGQPRNKEWIYTGSGATFSVTRLEAQRDCLWNLQLNFKQGWHAYYYRWEDLDLSALLGEMLVVEVLENGDYNLRYLDDDEYGDDPANYANYFNVLNDTGYPITEIYIYKNGSSRWGSVRNSRRVYDGNQTTVKLTSTELYSSFTWNIRIGFDVGKRTWSYVEWEDVDLRDYLGGTMMVSRYSDGGYYIKPYNEGF